MDNILQRLLALITLLLFISANLVPIAMIILKVIKTRRFETCDTALKLAFFLYFLTIISYIFLNISKDPMGWRTYVLWGSIATLVLLMFLGIALLQLRLVRGKGAIKKFFKPKE